MANDKKSGSGCLKKVLIFVAAMVVIGIIGNKIDERKAREQQERIDAWKENTEAQTEAPAVTAQEVFQVYEDSLVEDGITCCYHIPGVMMTDGTGAPVNNTIYQQMMERLDRDVYESEYGPGLRTMVYDWAWTEKVLSIRIGVDQFLYEYPEYYVYNVDPVTGEQMELAQVLGAYGYTHETFYEKVSGALAAYFTDTFSSVRETLGEEFYQQQLEATTARENVQQALPYVDSQGRLCVVVPIHGFAGAGSYYYCLCLDSAEANLEWIECQVH